MLLFTSGFLIGVAFGILMAARRAREPEPASDYTPPSHGHKPMSPVYEGIRCDHKNCCIVAGDGDIVRWSCGSIEG